MAPWVNSLMEATFDGSVNIEDFGGFGDEGVACFEEAVIMRHNEGGMSRERRLEVYDMMRCKARKYCDLRTTEDRDRDRDKDVGMIGLTMLMRTGPRSFRNESVVVGIFQRECGKVEGCRLTVAYSNNLTVCEQVDIIYIYIIHPLISFHFHA